MSNFNLVTTYVYLVLDLAEFPAQFGDVLIDGQTEPLEQGLTLGSRLVKHVHHCVD